jgi:hypothetical protein
MRIGLPVHMTQLGRLLSVIQKCGRIWIGSLIILPRLILAQPSYVTPEPTEADARKFFVEKLSVESEGRIVLGFLDGKAGAMAEHGGKVSHAVSYLAQLSFREPCLWQFQSGGSALSFKTTPLSETDQTIGTNSPNTLKVLKRGWGYLLGGSVFFEKTADGWIPTGFDVLTKPSQDEFRDFGRVTCSSNMKDITLGLRVWAEAHSNQFVFNVSTNQGGTKEQCLIGNDGFDLNPAIHFREMTNGYIIPGLLICPGESRPRATNMQSLLATNISYQLHTGVGPAPKNSKEVLLRCPIHGSIAYCDGSIRQGNK